MSKPEAGTSAECTACEHDLLARTEAPSKWLRLAVVLVAGTMLYNIAEAIVATIWGRQAESIALFGFGWTASSSAPQPP